MQATSAIVTAVIGMAKALKLETVAEGVETAAQAALLTELHCDEAQGYLYSKALPPQVLLQRWLQQPSQRQPLAAHPRLEPAPARPQCCAGHHLEQC